MTFIIQDKSGEVIVEMNYPKVLGGSFVPIQNFVKRWQGKIVDVEVVTPIITIGIDEKHLMNEDDIVTKLVQEINSYVLTCKE